MYRLTTSSGVWKGYTIRPNPAKMERPQRPFRIASVCWCGDARLISLLVNPGYNAPDRGPYDGASNRETLLAFPVGHPSMGIADARPILQSAQSNQTNREDKSWESIIISHVATCSPCRQQPAALPSAAPAHRRPSVLSNSIPPSTTSLQHLSPSRNLETASGAILVQPKDRCGSRKAAICCSATFTTAAA